MSNTPDRSSDLSQIFDEFLARRQRGESPVLDEYCQRFPDLAEQLRLHVRLYDALETVRPEGDTTLRDPGVLPRIPGYEVEAVLGQGGAGVVFRAGICVWAVLWRSRCCFPGPMRDRRN